MRSAVKRGNAVELFHQKIHRKLRWNRKELFAVLNDCHWKLTVAGAYSAFLMSAGRLNVSSGVFGPLFLIKQRRFIPVYTYIPLSSILLSRNSFICSLDRKKCPLVLRHFYLSCLMFPLPHSLRITTRIRTMPGEIRELFSKTGRRSFPRHRQSETALAVEVNVNDEDNDRTFSIVKYERRIPFIT